MYGLHRVCNNYQTASEAKEKSFSFWQIFASVSKIYLFSVSRVLFCAFELGFSFFKFSNACIHFYADNSTWIAYSLFVLILCQKKPRKCNTRSFLIWLFFFSVSWPNIIPHSRFNSRFFLSNYTTTMTRTSHIYEMLLNFGILNTQKFVKTMVLSAVKSAVQSMFSSIQKHGSN